MPETPDPPQPVTDGPGPDSFRGRTRLERAVLPYLREQTLWPVLVAVLVHIVALVSPILVLALRDRHGWSMFGTGVFVLSSAAVLVLDLRERRRPGLVASFLALVWGLCGLAAYAIVHFEIV